MGDTNNHVHTDICTGWVYVAWPHKFGETDYLDKLKSYDCTYHIIGAEICPTSGKNHYQGYIEFQNKKRGSTILKVFPSGVFSWAKRVGTKYGAMVYCTKENMIFERGDKPLKSKKGKRTDMETICEMIRDGATDEQIALQYPGQFIRYHRGMSYYRNLIRPTRDWKTEVIVYYGDPRTGKTSRARLLSQADGRSLYIVPRRKASGVWACGYEGEEDVLIDDFNSKIHIEDLLAMTDEHPCTLQSKFGQKNWCPRRIFITSNIAPSSWYSGCDVAPIHTQALFERFDEVWHYTKGKEPVLVDLVTEVLCNIEEIGDSLITLPLDSRIDEIL